VTIPGTLIFHSCTIFLIFNPITAISDKLLEYKRSWIQHVNRMPRNRLPKVMKYYSPAGRRNHGRSLKRLLVTWDRNGSTSGPTPWKIYDDDDDDDDDLTHWRLRPTTHSQTDHCTHQPLVQQIRNYSFDDMHSMYNNYKRKWLKHILL